MLFLNSAVKILQPLILAFLLVFLSACDEFINLKQIHYTVYPEIDNTVIPGNTTAISVSFNTQMEKLETQKTLSVSYTGGIVKGDMEWHNSTLIFTPLEPWFPGVRYTLSLTGTIYASDGREERISRYVYFYAQHKEATPYVLNFSPEDGKSVTAISNPFIRIVFSQAMEPFSTDSFSLEGTSNPDFLWSDNDTVLEIHPKTQLNPWTVYRWSISTKAKGKNGVPLGREVKGQFITDLDRTLPHVTDVYPLIRDSSASWLKTGASMDNGFGSGQAIGIEFNKAMDESALRNIRFDPSLPGRSEIWKDTVIVFIPDKDPEPDRTYTLYVSADSRDTEGLKMEKEYVFSFLADIRYLSITELDTESEKCTPDQNGIYSVSVTAPEGVITVIVRFSSAMETETQAMTALNTRLETFFPGTLRPIALRSVGWVSADTVVFKWEGISASTASEKHYYRMVFPGGRGGISNGKGSYLKEDVHLYLLAVAK